MSGRILLFALAGIAAALLTVVLTDVVRLIPIPEKMAGLTPEQARQHVLGAIAFGTLLALLLAAAGNWARGRGDWPRVLGIALPVGAALAFVGVTFGMTVMAPLYADPARNTAQFLGNVVARALAWMTIGGFAGVADGLRQRSVPVARNGGIGGLIGGFLGGVFFEIVPYLMPGLRSGAPSRLVGFAITGALIGFFVGLVRELFKEAWIRVVLGRNEGRELLVEKAQSVLGRAELCDIPLFGDPSVARRHALLSREGDGYVLRDTGESPAGVWVNDERIAGERPLRSGDRIRLGGRDLIFFERQVRQPTVPVRKEAPRAPTMPTAMPTSPVMPTPVPMSAAARLTAVGGPHTGAAFSLTPDAVIGRDPAVPIPLPADTRASRRHARMVQGADGWELEDLGSTNGTFVNGQRIQRVRLAPGDTLLVGESALRFDA